MGREDIPPVLSRQPLSNNRLESWKEIAAYLKREVRTVQRWEKEEGLPVHRHQHKKQGTVYADKAELDAWLEQRQPELDAKEKAKATRPLQTRLRMVLLAAALAVALAAVGYAAWRTFWSPPEKIMLAVLPFDNLSGDPEQDYFSEGLTEEMITQLGGLQPEKLGVIAWTTVRRYQGTEKTVEEIGHELGVDYIVEGSVRREDDRVRITAQLIQVNDQTHLWAETYEQELSGILIVQREVGWAIAREVRVNLSPQKKTRRTQMKSVDVEAYEAYLRGRQEFNRWSGQGFTKAAAYFEKAAQKDPNYALAYAWLAQCYNALAFFGYLAPHEAYPKTREAASKALEIDSAVVEAHLALAWARFAYDWNWNAAEREFRQAVRANPNSSMVHWLYAWSLTSMGRQDEALTHVRRALELDPFNPYVNTSFGDMLDLWRRYKDALEQYQKTLDRVPEFPWPHHLMANAYARRGMYEEAMAAERKYLRHSGNDPDEFRTLEEAYAKSGGDGYWTWRLRRLNDEAQQTGTSRAARFAIVYAQLGERDAAFEWLEKAYEERAGPLIFLNVNPAWDPLRDDPRFQALVRRVGLPP